MNARSKRVLGLVDGGILKAIGEDIVPHEKWGMPSATGEVVIGIKDAMHAHLAKQLIQMGRLRLIGRSGHSRIGVHPEFTNQGDIVIKRGGRQLIMPARISSLRGHTGDQLLEVLQDLVREGKEIEIGRLLLAAPETALRAEEIEEAKRDQQLWLPESAEIKEEGSEAIVEIPLENLRYFFSELNFDQNTQRDALLYGKHALTDVQDLPPENLRALPEELHGHGFMVGAIRISLGHYTAVIEPESNDPSVMHLAAQVLDGIKTTGIHEPRQVELFNTDHKAADLKNLKMRLKIYHTNDRRREFGKRIVTERSLAEGVNFADVVELTEHPERLLRLMRFVDPTAGYGHTHSLLLAGGRSLAVPWQDTEKLLWGGVSRSVQSLVSDQPGACNKGDRIDPAMRPLTDRLSFVGGAQKEGKVMASYAFPPVKKMLELMSQGVGVFLAHDLPVRDRLFENGEANPPGTFDRNALFFWSTLYEGFREATEAGARILMAFKETPDFYNPGEMTPAHVREFFRGFWVKPEEKERMEAVSTVIAMYGSHKEDATKGIEDDVDEAMRLMKEFFGDKVAVTHGKGPGVMELADRKAAKHNIFRVGVGIHVERKGQNPNFKPEAMADFMNQDRLPRQKLMDDISTFKLFNVGGAGTMEEVAITVCSQKLGKKLPTPIVLLDSMGMGGPEREHLFAHLHEHIKVIATEPHERVDWEVAKPGIATGMERVQLLQSWTPKSCHLVSSYTEWAQIVIDFVKDPIQYWKSIGLTREDLLDAWDTEFEANKKTGFPMPEWVTREQIEKWESATD